MKHYVHLIVSRLWSKLHLLWLMIIIMLIVSSYSVCAKPAIHVSTNEVLPLPPTIETVYSPPTLIHPVQLIKRLTYDKYTLKDNYAYQKVKRGFQWKKMEYYIGMMLAQQAHVSLWGVLQNYKNRNGLPPKTKSIHVLPHNDIVDSHYIRQYQGIPLYSESDLTVPVRYGLDGSLVAILSQQKGFYKIYSIALQQTWLVPQKYLHNIGTPHFDKFIFIDTKNQNIANIDEEGNEWFIRAMNPSSTGMDMPPFHSATPNGVFVVQQKKDKMYYVQDGTTKIAGYAPFALRFNSGVYVHGQPIQLGSKHKIEYSPSLGTVPVTHMCVRTTTSYAQFLYNWGSVDQTLVIVLP